MYDMLYKFTHIFYTSAWVYKMLKNIFVTRGHHYGPVCLAFDEQDIDIIVLLTQ